MIVRRDFDPAGVSEPARRLYARFLQAVDDQTGLDMDAVEHELGMTNQVRCDAHVELIVAGAIDYTGGNAGAMMRALQRRF